jgi:adenylate cyclase class 2
VRTKLDSFARFCGKVEKNDTYWYLDKPAGTSKRTINHIHVRIRQEIRGDMQTLMFTYKRKELMKGIDGIPFEVNDEKECILSDQGPLEALLADTGFRPEIRKHKTVYDWEYQTTYGKALLELCTVPPLGDFLEIEILASDADSRTVSAVRSILEQLMETSGIPLSAVEPRYYTDMLRSTADQQHLHR